MSDAGVASEDGPGRTPPLFLVLITLSGLAALVYQVAWTRRLSLLLGVSTYAVATVLAAFLGGLALGAWVLGRRIDQARRPLRIYALLEAGIGVLAFLFPFLLAAMHGLYVSWGQASAASGSVHLLARVTLCAVLVLPATFLMGATLPAMCRVLVRDDRRLGRDLGRVYGYNTLGAALGALLCGFVLISSWLSRREREGQQEAPSPAVTTPKSAQVRLVLAASAVSGFAALGYEVLWTRGLVTVLHTGFTYSLAIMLAAFLGGLVLGSFVFARFIAPRAATLGSLAWVQLGIGASALVSVVLLAQAPYLERKAVAMGLLGTTYTWSSWIGEVAVASGLVMLVPTTLMGIALPLSARLVVKDRRGVGEGMGVLYGWNTVGSILGALVAGFVLVPRIGTLNSLVLLAALNLVLAVALSWFAGHRRAWIGLLSAALVLLGVGAVPQHYFRDALSRWKGGELLYFAEDATGIVAVYEEPAAAGDTYRRLYVNETSYASSTTYARRYHKLLGHLPALLHPGPRRGLVIAFGTGMTAGALAHHPSVEQVDAVDISSAVLGAAPYFAKENGGFLDSPKARARVEDGRHHLLVSGPDYDVITLEPPPPRFAGIANLYSRDFYELCRSRLRIDGVVAQWIPMHSHTEEEMRMLVRSFVEVFPQSTLWVPVQRDAIIVGFQEPVVVDLAEFARRMAGAAVGRDLQDVDVDSPEALVATWFADADLLAEYVSGVRPITDDRPSIEFFAGRPLVEAPVHLERLMPFRMEKTRLLASLQGVDAAGLAELEVQIEAMDHFYRGSVLASQGHAAGRIREFRQALELDPDSRFFLRLNGRLAP
jgi:spermidine synthase